MPDSGILHINQRLTNISLAYKNFSLVGLSLFPTVKVDKDSDNYVKFDKENMRPEDDDRKADGSFNRINFTWTDENYKTVGRGLEHRIDKEKIDKVDSVINIRRRRSIILTEKLDVGQEKRIAALATASGNFTNSVDLDGHANGQWDDEDADVFKTVDDGIELIEDAVGVEVNTMLMSGKVWKWLRKHPAVLARLSNDERQKVTTAILAELFEIKNIMVAKGRYNNANENQDDNLTSLWGNSVVLAHVAPSPGRETVSFGYNFVYKNRIVEQYEEKANISEVGRVRYENTEKIVEKLCGFLIENAVSDEG